MSNSRSGTGRGRTPSRRIGTTAAERRGSTARDTNGKTYRGGRGPGRTGRRRSVVVALAVSLALTLCGIGVFAYAANLSGGLDRFDAFNGLDDRPDKVVDGSLNVLVLGSDSRNPDSAEGSRADTIMMLHIPADGRKAYIISLPRDLWVPIPPSGNGSYGGGEDKLNSAMSHGGIPLMVSTVENYSGVRVDHVIEIDFEGLKAVVDALGGVTMDVEMDFTSIHKPYREFTAGDQTMDGTTALDYVRQRKQFPDGDFARMRHQQELLMAMMDKATSAGIIGDPSSVSAFLESTIDAMKVDEGFDLIATALQFSDLRSNDLVFMTLPNKDTGWVGDENVVLRDDELAPTMFAALRDDELAGWVKKHPDAVK
ncbi:LCP family protein [Stackebrandtia soli]|uniref:LCP family protein n=1 Tax=Stackebrandtia soli TaxID=1892856 RepID=UPI0039E8D988